MHHFKPKFFVPHHITLKECFLFYFSKSVNLALVALCQVASYPHGLVSREECVSDFSLWGTAAKKGYFSGVSAVIFAAPLVILVRGKLNKYCNGYFKQKLISADCQSKIFF